MSPRAITSTPKTSAGKRSVPLDPSLVKLLKSHQTQQGAEKLAAGEAYTDEGYILADELGVPYHPDTISDWFETAVKATKLPKIRLHDTRHRAASLMLASGVPTKVVSELLGHSSPTITLSIYAHVIPGMAEDAGAALSGSPIAFAILMATGNCACTLSRIDWYVELKYQRVESIFANWLHSPTALAKDRTSPAAHSRSMQPTPSVDKRLTSALRRLAESTESPAQRVGLGRFELPTS